MSTIYQRALRLFDRYADLPDAERESGLADLQREDPDVHAALSALLAADSCPRPLDRPPVEAVAARMRMDVRPDGVERIGQQLGPWRIIAVIGQGGMGTVYRVERVDAQYRQTAALKCVRSEASTPALVEAFHNERSVLASLSHPDIVPLLDGGVDAEWQLWFVMQEVDGEAIDRWCDRLSLPTRERVTLFVRACDAIIYAHQRGILHQDIKPSNLLVTPDGRTQLLDFGLSTQILGAPDGRCARLAISSGYTAPEVLRGEPPGFGVDVYSLGVLLCRLLCGQWPVAPGAMVHEPRAPSALAAQVPQDAVAARAAGSHRALAGKLQGELDSIVLRCVDSDPARRYRGVDELQADLCNWLTRRPVSAYRRDARYRMACFIRRNVALVAIAFAIVLGLGATGGVWLWQQSRSEQERIASSHVDRLLESTLGMATLSGLGNTPLTPAALLQRSEDYLKSQDLDGQSDVRARGLSVLARSWAALGDYPRAEALADEARRESGGDALQSAFNMATLAMIQNARAGHAQAEASARKGLARLPGRLWSDQYRLARVRLLGQLAAAQSGQGQSAKASETLSTAIDEAAALPRLMGDAVTAQLLVQRGTWYRWRFRMAESEADLLRAIALARGSDPVIADDARESLVRTIRSSRAPGREERSLKIARELLASRQATLGNDHPQTGVAWAELAFIQMLNSDYEAARDSVDAAERILRESVGEEHPTMARVHIARAFTCLRDNLIDEALDEARTGLAIYRRTLGHSHEFSLDARFLVANVQWSKHSRTGEAKWRDGAIEMMRDAIADSVQAHGNVAAIQRLAYASLLASANRIPDAIEELGIARRDAESQYGANSQEALHVRSTQIAMATRAGEDPAGIEAAFMALIDDLADLDTLYARSIAHSSWLTHAQLMEKLGRMGDARSALLHARQEGVDAGQDGWVRVADLRIQELEGRVAGQAAARME